MNEELTLYIQKLETMYHSLRKGKSEGNEKGRKTLEE